MQKSSSFIYSLDYQHYSLVKKKKKFGGYFTVVSQSPDTTSHITVSTSTIREKLEIAYCMCLSFWTLGFWPNVAEKLLVRWYKLSFQPEEILGFAEKSRCKHDNWCQYIPEAGPLCGHRFWAKRALWRSWTWQWWQENECTSPKTWEGKWRRLSEWVRKWRC